MKLFKSLSLMALLMGAMLVTTGCKNDKKGEVTGEFPTAAELRGTWKFVGNVPLNIQTLLKMLQTTPEQVMIYLDGRGGAQAGTTYYNFETSYEYNEADGSFRATAEIDMQGLPMAIDPIEIDATLHNTTVANQIACTFEIDGKTYTVTLEKVSKDNLFEEEKPEPQDPEDPEDPEEHDVHIPTGVEIRGTWAVEGDLPGMPVQLEGVMIDINEGGQLIIYNDEQEFEGSYSYDEETGRMTIEFWIPGSQTPMYLAVNILRDDETGELYCSGEFGDADFNFTLVAVDDEEDEEDDDDDWSDDEE